MKICSARVCMYVCRRFVIQLCRFMWSVWLAVHRHPSKIMSNPSSLPSSTGDGERFTDCTRRQLNLDSRRGGYLLRVLLYLLPLLSAPLYGIFRLVADGARHRRRVTTMLFRLCF